MRHSAIHACYVLSLINALPDNSGEENYSARGMSDPVCWKRIWQSSTKGSILGGFSNSKIPLDLGRGMTDSADPTARSLPFFRMHSLGYLWEIGLRRRHNESSTVHPGSLGFTASARAWTVNEMGDRRSSDRCFVQSISKRRGGCRNGGISWRLSRKSLSADSHRRRRTARSLIARRVNRNRDIGASRLGYKGSLAFSSNGTSTSCISLRTR